jgi:hypothetical protein
MPQQVLLEKEQAQLFGYKKSVPLISTSCIRRCEKSQRSVDLRQSRADRRQFMMLAEWKWGLGS